MDRGILDHNIMNDISEEEQMHGISLQAHKDNNLNLGENFNPVS